ncbi:hypothetical protein AGMMS50289_26420 [Betaproteobacteria bacterium]|nr:hypothetical protein AGMMS50289_26420 [Betaproteobacteria bacterium]
MKKPTTEEVKKLIESHASIVNLGSSIDAVDEEWIVKAEAALNRPLPDSYKWFLKEYAGGDIRGYEIYSIYSKPFESAVGCDIVFQHLANRKAGLLDDSKLEFFRTDLDETFFFEYNEFQGGECPIYLWFPSGSVHYADNFYEFLYKRITEYSS